MEYLDVASARALPGMRVVLTAGVPGPWSEAAKALLHVKGIPWAAVRQEAGQDDPALRAWTGQTGAPVLAWEDERPRSRWSEQLFLLERLRPEPALLPREPEARARALGLAHELCGEQGLGWTRRLMLLAPLLETPGLPEAARAIGTHLGAKYGYSREAAAAAPQRVRAILDLLGQTLEQQRARGVPYLVGDALSAVDVYWAAFAAMVEPLPEEHCPMSPMMRQSYTLPEGFGPAVAPLLAHRDLVYREHLALPLDF